MLEDIKLLLGDEFSGSDDVLLLMLRDAEQLVLDYCHIQKLPSALEPVVRDIVMRQIRQQNDGGVNSVKRGDTQITYNTAISTGSFTDIDKRRLNAYRKWRAR